MSNGARVTGPRSMMSGSTMNEGGIPKAAKPATVAIDPVALVVTECITVTSAMRKHARWAHSSVSAILGGGPARHMAAGDRKIPHGRRGSSGSQDGAEEEGVLSTRWGLRGKKGKSMQDNPLLSAFARLRSDLKGCRGWSHHTATTQPYRLTDFVCRHTLIRRPFHSATLFASHSLLVNYRSNYFPGPHSHYQDALLQCHWTQ